MKRARSLVTKNILGQLILLVITCVVIYISMPQIIYMSTKDNTVKSDLDMNEQLMGEMDNYFKGLSKFASMLCNDTTITQLVSGVTPDTNCKDRLLLENYLANASNYYYMDSYQVIHVYLSINNGIDVSSVGMPYDMKHHIFTFLNKNESKKSSFLSGPFTINEARQPGVFVDRSNRVFCYCSPYTNSRGISGELVIVSSYDSISNILKTYAQDGTDFMLLDEANNPMYPGKSFKNSQITLDMIKKPADRKYYYFQTYDFINGGLLSMRYSLYSKWKLVRYDSENVLMSSSNDICSGIIELIVLGSLIYCVLSILLSQKSLLAIKTLSRQMREISRGNYDARIKIHTNDEIEELGKTFNEMADRLQKNIKKMVEQKRREQNMRYSLLVSQIDPHFIYNAMNTITYLASSGKNSEVIEVNKSMIGILKDRLRVGSFKVSDTLRQETGTIKNYLIIQSYRYKDMFDVRWDVDEKLLDTEIPKNILQPLVENALCHGVLANRDENGDIIGGYITITAKEDAEKLILSVKDSGAGMPQSVIDEVMRSETGALGNNQMGQHIGLCNILARLRYIYENDFVFAIKSKEGEGTEITIKISMTMPHNHESAP